MLRKKTITLLWTTPFPPASAGHLHLGGGFNFFNFHPYLGKIPILTNIFQMGWNHQLVTISPVFFSGSKKTNFEKNRSLWLFFSERKMWSFNNVKCNSRKCWVRDKFCLLDWDWINIWSNYSDLTRPGPPKGSWRREIPLFQGNLGWWNIIPFGHMVSLRGY